VSLLKGRGVIIALDLDDAESIRRLVSATSDLDAVTGYKVGFIAALTHGLKKTVDLVRGVSDKPIIYDHQKGMTDIPDLGSWYAKILRRSGVDAAIGFPHSGRDTLVKWVEALRDEGIVPIVGGDMTHEGFLRSSGGYVCDDSPKRIYEDASALGVEHYVLPGSKIERALLYADMIRKRIQDPVFLLPGIRNEKDAENIASHFLPSHRYVHIIVGRAVILSEDPASAVEKIASHMR